MRQELPKAKEIMRVNATLHTGLYLRIAKTLNVKIDKLKKILTLVKGNWPM